MKPIKLLIICVVLPLVMAFSSHIETVVVYKIHNDNDKLYVSATMEKKYATILVMSKGEMVTPKNRGIQLNKIVKRNTSFKINGINYDLKFESALVNQQNLVLKYYIENIPLNISSFTMKNDVIVGVDELAIVNAYITIKNENRKILRFNKKNNSRTIIYKSSNEN